MANPLPHALYLGAVSEGNPAKLKEVLKTHSIKDIAAHFPRNQSFYSPAFAIESPQITQLLLAHHVEGSHSKKVRKNDIKRLILTEKLSLLKMAFKNSLVTPGDIDKRILRLAHSRIRIHGKTNTTKIHRFLCNTTKQQKHHARCSVAALNQASSENQS